MSPKQNPSFAQVKANIDSTVERLYTRLREVNLIIWQNPELAYEEYIAHDSLCDFLEVEGFTVTRHAYGLGTAFQALSGSGGRLVNFNAEMDALPDMGHACGHNLIATSSLTAFLALSLALREFGIEGRTQLLGTPAEESGGGKIKLLDTGAYKGVDVSLMAHPGNKFHYAHHHCGGAAGIRLLARQNLTAEYRGKNAHAGANPWDGINALDAVVAGYNNISLLRQSLRSDERIHGAIVETPKAANVIAAYTKVCWGVRAPTQKDMARVVERVVKCLEAGATVTGCEITLTRSDIYSDLLVNETLCDRYQSYMGQYGEEVLKVDPHILTGSSDIGNISHVLPTIHPMFGIPVPSKDISMHHPDFAACAGTNAAHDAAINVGKSLCLLGWDVITDDNVYESVRADWLRSTDDRC